MLEFTEAALARETLAAFLERELGWRNVAAWKQEVFGEQGTLGRPSRQTVIARGWLLPAWSPS